jgi:hypothetical protein
MMSSVKRRTTLTLEEDVAARLQEEARRTGRSLKQVANQAIRLGLDRRRSHEDPPFELHARDMGLRTGMDLDDIEGLLDRIEGPLRR